VWRLRITSRSIANAVFDIGGAYGGGGRKLGDGNVVWVPVRPLRTEGEDHMGPNAPDLGHDCANGDPGVNFVNGPVRVAQDGDLADTEHGGSGSQLRFTNAADFNRIAALSK
jgi:hypothetical protein